MQKRIITDSLTENQPEVSKWLNLEQLADVEISSEDPEFPIEAALLPGLEQGWRAGRPGKQLIRLMFTSPQQVNVIQLCFKEFSCHRTQEYVVRTSTDKGESFREIIRQQWNFNPETADSQMEEHVINQAGVDVIELEIIPDISGITAYATLDRLRIS